MKKINISPSFLIKVYEKGYDYAVAEKLGLINKPNTSSMDDGKLLHAMLSEALGGDKAKIAISPFDSFRTKEAKEWRDNQSDDTAIITIQRKELLDRIVKRVLDHKNIKPFYNNVTSLAITEKVCEKVVNGHNIKGILDLIAVEPESKSVIDWKFVSSQVFDAFDKKALYQHYDLQAAVYDYLEEPTNIYFCAIENEVPYRIKLFHCDPSFLESGAEKFDKTFKILETEKWREPTFDIDEVGELISWNHYNG